MLYEPTILASVARLIGESLDEDYGVDPGPIFADLKIDTGKFFKPGARTSSSKIDALWRRAAAASGDPLFGFTAGRRVRPGDFFVLGHAWLASASLLGAITRLCRYNHIITTEGSELTLIKQDDVYLFTEVYPEGEAAPPREARDAGFVAFFGLCDAVTMDTVRPRSVSLTIASRLHCSRSTLQRQLSAEGTSYRDILETTRRALATHYLKDGDQSQAQIAFMIGFADQSNFARAFKRWTGVSPGEYRKAA